MFMLVAAEQLRHLVRRPGTAARAETPPGLPVIAPETAVMAVTPGTRYQLFRALRAMSSGEFMLVEHRLPDLPMQLETPLKRREWVKRLSRSESWQDQKEIEPVMVPGTGYPSIIGRIMIRQGWCAPTDQPHWVPNLRFFFLTEVGRESFRKAQEWWQALTALERLRLMLFE